MPRSRRDVEAALLAKGFVQQETDHHVFIYHTTAGKRTLARTKTSRSHHDIGDDLLGRMARQCKLTGPDFRRLVDCPMSRTDYEAVLVREGHVRADETAGDAGEQGTAA